MEHFVSIRLVPVLAVALIVTLMPIDAQVNTACSPSMISSVTPCINFITNSSSNGTSPTQECCSSLRTLTNTNIDCACLIVTGGVPLRVPINRTLAISLPRACNMPGVPLQCKTSGSPLAAPGPAALGPTLSPSASPSQNPTGSVVPGPTAQAPESDNTNPPSSTVGSEAPTATTDGRTNLTPSAAMTSYSLSPYLLFSALAFGLIKY